MKDRFPIRNVHAVVLHRRCVIDETIVNSLQSSNYCIEFTILREGGENTQSLPLCYSTLIMWHHISQEVKRT